MRLNLGAGPYPMKGWTNMDVKTLPGVDIVGSATAIPLPDESVDEVYGGHFMEHLSPNDTGTFLKELMRVLKPGGKFTAIVPDFRKVCIDYMKDDIKLDRAFFYYLLGYGDNMDETKVSITNPPHQQAYDQDKLFEVLSGGGFCGVCPVDTYTHPYMVAHGGCQSGFSCWKPK